jgi:Recombination endonuclease VII
MTVLCVRCPETDPTQFYADKRKKNGLSSWCKRCFHLDHLVKYQSDPQKYRDKARQRRYGLTREAYDALFEAQDGRCAVCRKEETAVNQYGEKSLPVDHDHLTGQVRGLVCDECNKGLGFFHDDPELLEAAATYLRAHVGAAFY